MIDPQFINVTLANLVSINSVNPQLASDGQGEAEIGSFIHQELSSFGFESSIDFITQGRPNVVARLKGTGTGKSLIINAHMDTVGVDGMVDPFTPKVVNDQLFGRGAYDMKGSIAAMLGMAKAIADNNITFSGDLLLTFVADEEFESIGTQQLLKQCKADACIVTEPTDLQICLGHRGFGVYEINTTGKMAHGGLHHEGIDANLHMGFVLRELQQMSCSLKNKMHPRCGEASLHVPLIKGGQSLFIYSDSCTIHVERRTIPGENQAQVLAELNALLQKLGMENDNFKSTIKELIWRNPYEVDQDAPIVKSLHRSMVGALKPGFIGHTWWEDSGLFGEAGIETVIIGPKGGGIHQQNEWVDLASVHQLSSILLQTSIDFCN